MKQLGNHTFLVGTPVAIENNSTKLTAKNAVVWWVVLSEVTEFYEFDDLKGYRQTKHPAGRARTSSGYV